jgi:hypothetical protein
LLLTACQSPFTPRPTFAELFETDSEVGVEVWEAATGRTVGPRVRLKSGCNGPWAIGLSPDGRTAVVSMEEGLDLTTPTSSAWRSLPLSRVLLIEVATGRVRRRLPLLDSVCQCVFSPDGRHLLVVGEDGAALVWEVYPAAPGVGDSLWADLAGADAEKAFAAVCRMVSRPGFAVKEIGRRLRPVALDRARVRRWIADLDHDAFARRAEATRELAALGEVVEADLVKACAAGPSLEARLRLERLLAQIRERGGGPVHWQRARALEVVEQVGTKEAQRVLRRLARGAPEARLTREAKAALARLAKRP